MDATIITSTIAGICMAICQVPQAVQVYKAKSTKGTSLLMQTILTSGIFFWCLTGVLMNQAPMYLSNGFCLVFCLYILVMCIRDKWKEKRKKINDK